MTANRFSTIVAVSVIAALALLTISMLSTPRLGISSSHGPANEASASLAQRQDEWTAGVAAVQAYVVQRFGEQTAGGPVYSAQQAYLDQRSGEQGAGGPVPNAERAYLDYRRGEWTGK
ncbi:MAG TPA: hypothetical protein VF784_11060 [Anaerolineales bacterium]